MAAAATATVAELAEAATATLLEAVTDQDAAAAEATIEEQQALLTVAGAEATFAADDRPSVHPHSRGFGMAICRYNPPAEEVDY